MAEEEKYMPDGQEEEEEDIDDTVGYKYSNKIILTILLGLYCTKRCCTVCH